MKDFQCRQGDIYFEAVSKLPKGLKPYKTATLAYGEVTGHSHRVSSHTMECLDIRQADNGDLFMHSTDGNDVAVSHEEHGTITVPSDSWIKVFHQREYDPYAIEQERRVAD